MGRVWYIGNDGVTVERVATIDDFIGSYGPEWVTGILSEHLGPAEEAGMVVHRSISGRNWVTGPNGGPAYPLLCSEARMIDTEDGPITGRCGMPVMGSDFACLGHQEEIDGWRQETEAEKVTREATSPQGELR